MNIFFASRHLLGILENEMANFTALFAALAFGLSLIDAGKIYPAKVIGLLDLAGRRDPSQALLTGNQKRALFVVAIVTGLVLFELIERHAAKGRSEAVI